MLCSGSCSCRSASVSRSLLATRTTRTSTVATRFSSPNVSLRTGTSRLSKALATKADLASALGFDDHGCPTALTSAEITEALTRCSTEDGCLVEDAELLATCLGQLANCPSSPQLLRRMRPNDLASVLKSLARLNAPVGDDCLAELDAACWNHPGPFDPDSTTSAVQALAALHASAKGDAAAAARPQAEAVPAAVPAPAAPKAAEPRPRTQSHQPQRGISQHGWQRLKGAPSPAAAATAVAATAAAAGEPAGVSAAAPSAAAASAFRFPQAVFLRLLQGGAQKYSYEQLAALLQAFRTLGVAVDDASALQLGQHMAAQLMSMPRERQQAALAGMMGRGGY